MKASPGTLTLRVFLSVLLGISLLLIWGGGLAAAPGDTLRCSTDSSGAEGNVNSSSSSLSPDGRYVAFCSSATNLVSGDTNTDDDVFRKELAVPASAVHSTLPPENIKAWGSNNHGQCNVAPGDDYVAISAGGDHGLALRSNGSLAAWGQNDDGQCNVPAGNDYVAIAAGYWHSLALRSDGSLVAWGRSGDGQCNVPAGNNYVAIAAGGYHSLALKSNGSLAAWGNNVYGQCNVPAGNDYVAISAGDFHSLALKSDGSLVAWGRNGDGQCNVPAGSNYVAIAAGGYHSLALRSNGSLAAWGLNNYGQATVPAGNDYVAIAAGEGHCLALRSNGSLAAWGWNNKGQAIAPAGNNYVAIAAGGYFGVVLEPASSLVAWGNNTEDQCNVPAGNNFLAIATGNAHNLLLKSDGSLAAWGLNNYGQATVPVGNNYVAVAAGLYHSLALKSDGSLAAWGDDSDGQVSNVPAGNNYVAVAGGGFHSLALKSDGSLAAWGLNNYNQCNVPGGNDYVAVDGGDFHSVALKSDGSLAAWGRNNYGQCNVPAGNDYVAISAGGYHNLALRSNGSLAAWGRNANGESSVPAGSNYVAISAGGYHNLALRSNGSLAAWGWNNDGQCNAPTGSNYVAISAGGFHSLALSIAYAVNASAPGGHGAVSPASQATNYGGTATIDITPDDGYQIASITDNGAAKPIADPYVISNVKSNHTVVVTFEAVPSYSFYFAEGYTGAGFQEYLCLGNPGTDPLEVTVTFLFGGGGTQVEKYTVPSQSRFTVDVNGAVGAGKDVSIVCNAPSPFVAERPMYFTYGAGWTGGHDAVGARAPSEVWYFAEGYTGAGFDEYVCVLNPGAEDADLTFRFQTPGGEQVVGGNSVPAHSRRTFLANQLLGGAYEASLKLESTAPVVAERPMYFNYTGYGAPGWNGGHCVMGAPELASEYYFAEGYTGAGFDEYLTIQNPNDHAITVTATYQLGAGQGGPVNTTYTVPKEGRSTVYVNGPAPNGVGPGVDVSVHLTCAEDFLAERPMYFNYSGMGPHAWTGGHCVIGAVGSADTWFFAEGYTGAGFEEWICIQNPGGTAANVTITYYPEGGGDPVVCPQPEVGANSRYTAYVNGPTNAGPDRAISAMVTSDQPVICERPMYFDFFGLTGGHDVVGYTP